MCGNKGLIRNLYSDVSGHQEKVGMLLRTSDCSMDLSIVPIL
jgi:hypothetical protein